MLDALDEVNELERQSLFNALEKLVYASETPIKVFISSRDACDIVTRLASNNDICIQAGRNASDIATFVEERVVDARLLNGRMTEELQVEVSQRLKERAQGMFRLVDLHVQQLRTAKTAADIRIRLRQLPNTLESSYQDIYEHIRRSGENAEAVARMTIQWLLIANRELP